MKKADYYILTINPGSMSTKVGYHRNTECLLEEEVLHDPQELSACTTPEEEFKYRRDLIMKILKKNGADLTRLDAVVGRGGFIKPVESGTYQINQAMLTDLKTPAYDHPSNLGAPLAWQIAQDLNIPAYLVDPVVVDEMSDLAHLSGMPEINRKSIFHALNIRAVAHIAAGQLKKKYNQLNMIVVHMGGGISVTAHQKGRIVDVNNALLGQGPFSPRRAGTLPIYDFACWVLRSGFNEKEVFKKLAKGCGLYGYLGTDNGLEIDEAIERGDKKTRFILEAMAYQIAKEVGAMATVLEGKIDSIVFSGGLSRSPYLMDWVKARIGWIAPITIIPGQKELDAMATGALKALTGEEKAKTYSPQPPWSVERAIM